MSCKLSIEGKKFLINNKLTYSEIPNCPDEYKGLLMNARFIQGIFDDKIDVKRFNRFGRDFDPEKNTDELIASLPDWYAKGLRAFTVGFQGGGPCFTMMDMNLDNNPFSEDGCRIDQNYLRRMKKIIGAAEQIGMVVIVSYFYGRQVQLLKDDKAVIEAVKVASNWIRDNKFTNVMIEVANEHDIEPYKVHPILFNDKGIVELIEIAKRESGGYPVGCSSTGAYFSESITKASDVVLIHGNNMSRQIFYNQIKQVQKVAGDKPVLCNEDSQALSNMQVALNAGVSWGYYNNMTKQEPPTDWTITAGEDEFFAKRMAETLGIEKSSYSLENQFCLMGLKKNEECEGKRWIRLGSIYPEQIVQVAYYRNGEFFDMAYDDPFSINFIWNWAHWPTEGVKSGENWEAVVTLATGEVIVKKVVAE